MTVPPVIQADCFSPLLHRVEGIPAGTGKVYWASERLAGTSDGVFQLRGFAWQQSLVGREILAIGEMPQDGWWASGAGFVALSSGVFVPQEEEFYGGCASREGLFLSGKQGVWRLIGHKLELVHPLSSPERIRIFLMRDRVCLYSNSQSYVWRQSRFVAEPLWPNTSFRDILTVRPIAAAYQVLAFEGLFELNEHRITPIYPDAFRDMYSRGMVGFHVGKDYAVLASFFEGIRAVSDTGQILWQFGIKELGGNPYSLLKTRDGFLVGTSGGAVTLLSEAFLNMPLPGETVQSVGSQVHLPSGSYDLRTGRFFPRAPFVEGDGATGAWGSVTLPGGKVVRLPGREVQAVFAYRDGWFVLQDAVLTSLDAAGAIHLRLPVVAADSAGRDGDQVWIGSATGLFRFDGTTLLAVEKGGPVRVEHGESGPVFVAGDRLSFPDGTSQRLPGRVRAVSGGYAAIQVGTEVFVGRYTGGSWKPLDTPAIANDVSHLRADGDLLYVVSPHGVMRIQLSKTGFLSPRNPSLQTAQVETTSYTGRLPHARPAPWPSPHFSVRANGEAVSVTGRSFEIPRLPFGVTEVEITESIGGLNAQTLITLERLRPWWLDWPGAILFALGAAAAVWALIRWRTHRLLRRAQELQRLVDEKTKALGEAVKAREFFFSSVSHEIRNPLNGVVGLCDMLNESAVGPRERLLVKTLKSCSEQLRHILDDVLDFSRIDRGEMEFHPEVFDLGPAVAGAARAVDPTLARVQLFAPEAVWVEGDAGKLRQVVTNLVSNALKYGQPPMARVEVQQVLEDSGYIAIGIKVSNSGPDLSASEQQTIFQGFQRGNEAKRQRLPGEGLGLALSQRIMRAMKGDLTVQSGGGLTTFCLSIILRPGTPAAEPDLARSPVRSSKALAIEDEHYNRLVLGHLLGQLGYEVDWAVDGAAAMEAVKTGSYDLILTDYMLPDMDGVELTKKILATVAAPPPPVVMVTAYSTQEKQDAAYAAGVSGFVTKPVTLKKLQAALLGLGYGMRGRRSLDVVRAAGRFDFAVFHRMNEGRVALGRFADDFETDFQALTGLVHDKSALLKAAHALRGRALIVHATSLAEQLAILEAMAAVDDHDQVTRVLSVIESMVADVAASARTAVFTSSDFGKSLGQGVAH